MSHDTPDGPAAASEPNIGETNAPNSAWLRPSLTFALSLVLIVAALIAFRLHQRDVGAIPVATTPEEVAPGGVPRAWEVTVGGAVDGQGTAASPLNLSAALSAKGPVRPGDTVWVRGGTYRGTFRSDIAGTEEAPIIVRARPGERVVIDSVPSNEAALYVTGAHVWFWGLEIMNSDPSRYSDVPFATNLRRGDGVHSEGRGTKFINMIVHDMRNGLGVWRNAVGGEVYGSIIFNNGYASTDRGHGHGIYTQNEGGTRKIADNILFGGFGAGIHAYGSSAAALDDMHLLGNILVNSGPLSPGTGATIVLGGGVLARRPVVKDNYTYMSLKRGNNHLGWDAGCTDLTATGNYFAHLGNYPLVLQKCDGVIENNTFLGFVSDEQMARYPQNEYSTARPTTNRTFVRPNQYERGRAHVAVFNWKRLPTVAVDLEGIGLEVGASFEIRDAMNFFGSPVVTGRFTGKAVDIPMRGLVPTPAVGDGLREVAHTAPEFGAFVVMPRAE
jgi:hypothetical protein